MLLTGQSFDGLRVILGDDDEPELVCLRRGAEVPIDGLSDGTKDQLFLALRLATIAEVSIGLESLPLILDDVVANFDEERTRLALQLLAEVGSSMQVLLFTHQERVVDLAREIGLAPGAIITL
ncbi:MAG: hypothetical protein U0271_22090 [Polyangiaceae bacterium]